MKQHTMTSHGSSPSPANVEFGLYRDPWGQLVLTRDGEELIGVRPVRLFPLTAADHWVSLVTPEGHEALLIENPQFLTSEIRELLFEELAQRDLLPVITRIVNISAASSPADWDVETDRGPTRFTVSSDDDLRLLGANGVLILDAYGTRYLVPDLLELDAVSQRLLNRHL